MKNLILGLSSLFLFSFALPGLASAMDNPCDGGIRHPGSRGMMYMDKEKYGGKHGKMMQEMHKMKHGGMKGMNPCTKPVRQNKKMNPCNPCESI
jgi:hypothetical protein